jgi:tripartite-type tricarboxylate transporter receptor subunit TctC
MIPLAANMIPLAALTQAASRNPPCFCSAGKAGGGWDFRSRTLVKASATAGKQIKIQSAINPKRWGRLKL